MKHPLFAGFLALAIALIVLATPGGTNKTGVGFMWDPPPTNESPAGYWLYVSTNLVSPFNYSPGVMTNQVSAAARASFKPILYVDGGNTTNVDCPGILLPGWPKGQWFFALTVTNQFGESDFSNAAWTRGIPAAPIGLRGTGAF